MSDEPGQLDPQYIPGLHARLERYEKALREIAKTSLRDSNGGRQNAVMSVHDAAHAIHIARIALEDK